MRQKNAPIDPDFKGTEMAMVSLYREHFIATPCQSIHTTNLVLYIYLGEERIEKGVW